LKKPHLFLFIQLNWPDSQHFPSGVAICRDQDRDYKTKGEWFRILFWL